MPRRHLRSAVRRLHQKPYGDLCGIVEAGVAALIKNAEHLLEDAKTLSEAGRHRMSRLVTLFACEELAKIDILWESTVDPQRRSLARYYKHLERLLSYAIQNPGLSFSDYADIQSFADIERRDFYGDGAFGELLFPNDLVSSREDSLYVDYVLQYEWTSGDALAVSEGWNEPTEREWSTPTALDHDEPQRRLVNRRQLLDAGFFAPATAQRLITRLDVDRIYPSTGVLAVHQECLLALNELASEGLYRIRYTGTHHRRVVPIPLVCVDLSPISMREEDFPRPMDPA